MRGSVVTCALALVLAGRAQAQDATPPSKGGVMSQFLSMRPGNARVEKADDAALVAKPTVSPAQSRQAQAMTQFLRRQEVCQRLSEIADQTNDRELQRKAEQLEARAWDAYLQQAGGTMAADEAKLQQHLAPDSPSTRGRLTQSLWRGPTTDPGSTGQARGAREDSR